MFSQALLNHEKSEGNKSKENIVITSEKHEKLDQLSTWTGDFINLLPEQKPIEAQEGSLSGINTESQSEDSRSHNFVDIAHHS